MDTTLSGDMESFQSEDFTSSHQTEQSKNDYIPSEGLDIMFDFVSMMYPQFFGARLVYVVQNVMNRLVEPLYVPCGSP